MTSRLLTITPAQPIARRKLTRVEFAQLMLDQDGGTRLAEPLRLFESSRDADVRAAAVCANPEEAEP